MNGQVAEKPRERDRSRLIVINACRTVNVQTTQTDFEIVRLALKELYSRGIML